jgi:hypothetical protein
MSKEHSGCLKTLQIDLSTNQALHAVSKIKEISLYESSMHKTAHFAAGFFDDLTT